MSGRIDFRKWVRNTLFLIIFAVYGCLFATADYYFPSYSITRITGGEVKRVDKDGPITKANPADGPTRDVYYVYTQNPKTDKVMVYRNEDTRWGFPFYFKFDSADVQAQAQSFVNTDKLAQVKYYGWRIEMFDEFPNLTSLKAVSADATPGWPVGRYFAFAVLLILLFVTIQVVRGWFDSTRRKQ